MAERSTLGTIDRFEARGYEAHMHVLPGGQVRCGACRGASEAAEVPMDAVERFEGTSDPADEQLVAAVRCPRCQACATLVLSYGPQASAEDAMVLADLQDHRGDHPTIP